MGVFDLVASISLDTSGYESSLNKSKGMLSSFGTGMQSKAVAIGNLISSGVEKAAGALKGFASSTVQTGMSFDTAMGQVAATMGKTVDDIGQEQESAVVRGKKFTGTLRDYAKFVGETTEYSATQAAQALNYMALAGYSTKESMDMLPNVLNLASAGAMDMAQASDMVTDAQTALGLSFEETNTMVDQMAKTASTTNTNVEQLGNAFLTVGANAQSMAAGAIPTTKEMSMVLGILADNGIKGAEGGTHLRNILKRLAKPTDDSAAAMKELGVNAYDAQGNLRDLPDVFMEIAKAEDGMTQKQKDKLNTDLFNGYDLAAVNSLLKTTSDRWDEVGTAIDNAKGSAEEMANTQMDNLHGDVTLFQSALEAVQIAISDKITPALRSFVQIGTDGLSALSKAINEGNFDSAVTAITDTISKAIDKFSEYLPQIMEVVTKVIISVANGIAELLPQVLPVIIPALVQAFVTVTQALIQSLPSILSALGTALTETGTNLGANLPVAIFLAFQLGIGKQPFGETIVNVFKGIKNIGSIVTAIAPVFSGLGTVIGGLSKVFSAVGTAAQGFFAILAANPIVLVITLIAGLVTALVVLYNKNKAFHDFVNGMFEGIKNGILSLGANIKTAFEEIGANFSRSIENIKSGLASMGSDIASGVSSIGSAIGGFFTQTLPSFVGSGVNALKDFGSKAASAFKNAGSKAASLASKLGSVFTKKIPSAASRAVSALKKFGSNAASSFRGAAKKAASMGSSVRNVFVSVIPKAGAKAISFFKTVPGKVAGALKSLPGKVASVGRNAFNLLKNAFSGVASIGRNIVSGIWRGISGAAGWLYSRVTGFAKNVYSKIAGFFQIHSPSKLMRDKIGKNIVYGIALGIKDATPEAVKAALEMAGSVVTTSEQRINKGSGNWKGLYKKVKKTKKKKNAKVNKMPKNTPYKKIKAARKKNSAELLELAKTTLEKYEEYNKRHNAMTLADEVNYWDKVRRLFKKGSKERYEADKEYHSKRDELRDKEIEAQKTFTDKIAEAEKTYQDALQQSIDKLKDRKDELLSAFELFEKFDTGELVNKTTLTENLKSQVGALKDWTSEIEVLRSRIGDTALFDEIEEMGVSGLQQVRALNTMSTEELARYGDLYKERDTLADKESKRELFGTLSTDASDAYSAFMKSISDAYSDYVDTMEDAGVKVKGLSAEVKESMKQAGVDLSDVLKNMDATTAEQIAVISDTTKAGFKELTGSMKKYGKDLVRNFTDGIITQMPVLGTTIKQLLKTNVKDFIGFSEPKAGPLSDFHTYAPDMIDLFVKGISENAHRIGETFDNALSFADVSGQIANVMNAAMAIPQGGTLNIPGLPSLTPVQGQESGSQRPVNLNVTMQVGKTQFAKLVYRLNKEESQRVGVNLASGHI